MKDFKLLKLDRETRIRDLLEELLVIEDQVKVEKKSMYCHNDGKNMRNPCRVHNGGHEWDDCRKNPKNRKERGRTDGSNNNNRDNDNKDNRDRRGNMQQNGNSARSSGRKEFRTQRPGLRVVAVIM